MPRRTLAHSVAIALCIAAVNAAYQWWLYRSLPDRPMDFDQLYVGAKALLSGVDPYSLVGPDREFEWPWKLYYPAPALVAVAPLTLLPMKLARGLFVTAGTAVFAFAVAWRGGHPLRWLVFLSGSWLEAIALAQGSGYLAAAAVLPWVGIVLVAKPNIGVAIMFGARRLRDLSWPIAGGSLLLAASLMLQVDWPGHWLEAIRDNEIRSAPIMRPWGFLLLLSLVRWRRPEARLLFALSVVSQTPHSYDLLLLFLVPFAALEHVALVILSQIAFAQSVARFASMQSTAWYAWYGESTVWLMFIPCVLMILRRPNTGPVPLWVESRIARWPRWIRGTAHDQSVITRDEIG